jgi:hypothetical protein
MADMRWQRVAAILEATHGWGILMVRSAVGALLLCTLHPSVSTGEFGAPQPGQLVSAHKSGGHHHPVLVEVRRRSGRPVSAVSRVLVPVLPRALDPAYERLAAGSGRGRRVLPARSGPHGARSPPPAAVRSHGSTRPS